MKLPPKNSRTMSIVDALRRTGPVTIQQGIELHGTFNKMTLADLVELYDELVAFGCLEHVGTRYCVTEALLNHYHPKPAAPKGPLVPGRAARPFRPLSARFMVSSRGLREGSNDLRAAASVYAVLGTEKIDA